MKCGEKKVPFWNREAGELIGRHCPPIRGQLIDQLHFPDLERSGTVKEKARDETLYSLLSSNGT